MSIDLNVVWIVQSLIVELDTNQAVLSGDLCHEQGRVIHRFVLTQINLYRSIPVTFPLVIDTLQIDLEYELIQSWPF